MNSPFKKKNNNTLSIMLNNECSQSNSRCIENMTATLNETPFKIDAYDSDYTPKYLCKNGEPTIKLFSYTDHVTCQPTFNQPKYTMTLSYPQNQKGKETIKMIFSTYRPTTCEKFSTNPITLTRDDGGPPPSSSGCTPKKCAPDQHTLPRPKWYGCECHNTSNGCDSTNPCAVWPGRTYEFAKECKWFKGWNQFLGTWTFKNLPIPTHFSPKSQPKPMHLVPGIHGGPGTHVDSNALAIGLGVGLGVGIPVLLTLLYYLTKTKRKSKRK